VTEPQVKKNPKPEASGLIHLLEEWWRRQININQKIVAVQEKSLNLINIE
jgi:hypothetical protein